MFCYFKPHLLNNARITPIFKLHSKEFYNALISSIYKEPSSQKTLLEKLSLKSLPWKNIYTLPRKLLIDSYSRIFQFKCSHNILYLNNILHKCGLSPSPLCSYCNLEKETIVHLFSECKHSISLWKQLQRHFCNNFLLPNIDPQSAFFGFINGDFIQNNILLVFKLSIYRYRNKPFQTLERILKYIKERELLERGYALTLGNISFHNKKWENLPKG